MDLRCQIQIDELIQCLPLEPTYVLMFGDILLSYMTVMQDYEKHLDQKECFEGVLQEMLYNHFYDDFCDYHKVLTRHSFVKLGGDVEYSAGMFREMTIHEFLYRAIRCKFCVTTQLDEDGWHIGKEPPIGMMIAMFWPHTFVVQGSTIGPDGLHQKVVIPELNTIPPALPLRYKDDGEANIPAGTSIRGGKKIKANITSTLAATKESRMNALLPVISAAIRQAPVDWAYAEKYKNSRLVVDRAIMEMVGDMHNEMCPCCYMSLVEGTTYIDYSASAREMVTCHSHILSKHYLISLGVSAASDLRHSSKVMSSPDSMALYLLCTTCDNKQGEWEGLIKNNEKSYKDIPHLYWYGCVRSGGKDNLMLTSERNLFCFLVPNIYRMCLLEISSSDHIFVLYCDIFRQYIHKHLVFPDGLVGIPLFYLYVFVVNVNVFEGLRKRWQFAGTVPNVDFDYALSLVEYATYLDKNPIGVLVAPFVVCVSTEVIPNLSQFLVEDTIKPRLLAFPDSDDYECIDYIAIVIQKAYESQIRAEKNFPVRLQAEKDKFLAKATKMSEQMPALLLIEYICGYIFLKKTSTDVLGPSCRALYSFYSEIFQKGEYGAADSSVVLSKIQLLDNDIELRNVCINYFSPHAVVVQNLFDFFDRM